MVYIFPKHIPRKKKEKLYFSQRTLKERGTLKSYIGLFTNTDIFKKMNDNAKKKKREKMIRLTTARSNKDVEDGKNEQKTNNTIVYIIEFMLFVLIVQVDSHNIHQNHTQNIRKKNKSELKQ